MSSAVSGVFKGMSDAEREEAQDPLLRQALEWLVRLRDEGATPAEREGFAAWLAEGEAQQRAWQAAEALWARFDCVAVELGRDGRRRGAPAGVGRRALLGGFSLAVLGAAAWWATRPGRWADLKTAPGELRRVVLADGSTLELGSHTALSHDFTALQRRLTLHRGEIHVTVAADARPFLVTALGGETRALGTRFNLRALDGEVTVTVAEHAVLVTLDGASETVTEGWQVAYRDRVLMAPAPADLSQAEAWREGRLVFRNTPLRRVLGELERYRVGSILLLDEAVGEIPVTAVFRAADGDAALETIAATLPVRLVWASDLLVLVMAR